MAKRWFQTFETWSNFGNFANQTGCLHFVSFRNLQKELPQELAKLGKFLGVKAEYLQGPHLDCVVRNSKGQFKRRKYEKPKNIFDHAVNKTIDMYRERVNLILDTMEAGFTV